MEVAQSTDDQKIIDALKEGGSQRLQFEKLLFRKYAYFVPHRPGKYRLSEEEAKDAYADAFIAVIGNIVSGKFRGESTLKTYLSRIFRNKCVDRFRKNTTKKVNWAEEFPELPDESKDFVRGMIASEELEDLKLAMGGLTERCRELLWLSGQGFSPAEIADKMGFKTPRSVSSQRYKCMEKLRELISGSSITEQ